MSKLLSGKFTIIAAALVAISFTSVSNAQMSKGLELATKLASKVELLPAASRAAAVAKIGAKIGKPNLTLSQLKGLEISPKAYSQAANVLGIQSELVTGAKNLSNSKIANETVNTSGTTLGQRPVAKAPIDGGLGKVSAENTGITAELSKIEAQVSEIPANAETKAVQTEIVNANKTIAEDTGVMVLGEESCAPSVGSFGKLDAVAYKNLSTIFTTKLQPTAKLVKQKFSTKEQRLRCGAQQLANAFYEGASDVLKYQRGLEALQVTAQVNAMCVRKRGSIANVANKWLAAGKTAPQIEAACAL